MELMIPTPVIEIEDNMFEKAAIRVYIKREDLLHPVVSGNKWRKLKYNLQAAKTSNMNTILTFGGAFSNHIAAVAFAARSEGLSSVGVIRGEKTTPLNFTLQEAERQGMQLHFVSRQDYRLKENLTLIQQLENKFGPFYLVPEGGANLEGVKGVTELAGELVGYSHICVPVGTGTTLAGLVQGKTETQFGLGFAVLKGKGYLENRVEKLIDPGSHRNWSINHEFHFGGYAKFDADLISFINEFRRKHTIQLDPIYTGKMFFGIHRLAEQNYFPENSKLVVIHTGGLQGIVGFNQRFGNIIN